MATIETARRGTEQARRPGGRRVRVVIRRVNPWSVLKFSLLFYLCVMLVVLLGLVILYAVLSSLGVVDAIEDLAGSLALGDRQGNFQINGGYLFRTAFLIGLISTALWAAVTVFLAFLYNLIADLVGGIEVTLAERR
ncbi:MAG TPA: DUF3566 domain-containing protein [Actinomycetota bacterium]|nr:DUF3566 domain-containing protein [Actinomycetota bacterium]